MVGVRVRFSVVVVVVVSSAKVCLHEMPTLIR